MSGPGLVVQGMHGMGDCVHQRAVVRQLMRSRTVWLETSWPAIYHDLVGPDLHLLRKHVGLRTQAKNAEREAGKFVDRPSQLTPSIRVMYHGADVMQTDSKTVLESMCRVTGTDYATADFRLPVPGSWRAEYLAMNLQTMNTEGKPLLVYRPLVARGEWRGSMARNANVLNYVHLFAFLREHFFVISVADLEPGKEWLVGPRLKADVTLHSGELTFEAMAALFQDADLVFTSSGFAAILAPAVGTPCISIVGGYEDGRAHDSGKRFAPYLAIEPSDPCRCWSSGCQQHCSKEINMLTAVDQMAAFLREHLPGVPDILPRRGIPTDMYDSETAVQRDERRGQVFEGETVPARGTANYQRHMQQMRAQALQQAQSRGLKA